MGWSKIRSHRINGFFKKYIFYEKGIGGYGIKYLKTKHLHKYRGPIPIVFEERLKLDSNLKSIS